MSEEKYTPGPWRVDTVANAKLIAAAPELLKILKLIVADHHSDMRKSLFEKARSIIERATSQIKVEG